MRSVILNNAIRKKKQWSRGLSELRKEAMQRKEEKTELWYKDKEAGQGWETQTFRIRGGRSTSNVCRKGMEIFWEQHHIMGPWGERKSLKKVQNAQQCHILQRMRMEATVIGWHKENNSNWVEIVKVKDYRINKYEGKKGNKCHSRR